jgi:hypothetical protein
MPFHSQAALMDVPRVLAFSFGLCAFFFDLLKRSLKVLILPFLITSIKPVFALVQGMDSFLVLSVCF